MTILDQVTVLIHSDDDGFDGTATPPADQEAITTAMVEALRNGAAAAFGSASGATIVPLRYNGDFAWDWTTGAGDVNQLTYNYISGAISPDAQQPGTYTVGGSGSMASIFGEVLKAVAFQLSPSDETALQAATTRSQVQSQAITASYNNIIGRITPAMITTAKSLSPIFSTLIVDDFSYIMVYEVGYAWAGLSTGQRPLTLVQLQSAPDLRTLLQYAPASAEPILAELIAYLSAIGPQSELMDQESNGTSTLAMIAANLAMPSETNGGVPMSNPASTAYFPGFASSMSTGAIVNSLSSTTQPPAVVANFSSTSSQTSSYDINFSGGGSIPFVGDLIGISAGTSFQGDMAGKTWSGSQLTVEMSYPGATLVPFAPTAYSSSSAGPIGWLAESVIFQALTNFNSGSNSTGYTFPTGLPAGITLGANGSLGYISALVISAYPTISITYTEGNFEEASSWVATQTNFSVNLFGFIPIGGGSVNTYTAQAHQSSSNESFTITLTPPAVTTVTDAMNQLVPVLGAQIAWVGGADAT